MAKVTLNQPITIAATEEKDADALWVKQMIVSAPSMDESIAIYLTVIPYVSSTGEMLNSQLRVISIPNLNQVSSSNSDVANAIDSFTTAFQSLINAIDINNNTTVRVTDATPPNLSPVVTSSL